MPVPRAARDGSLAVEARAEGVPESRTVVVFGWIEGEQLANAMTERNLETYGEVAARLHAQARAFVPPAGMKTWDSPYPFLERRGALRRGAPSDAGRGGDAPFERARASTLEAIARLAAAEPPRMIHADLHEDNAFVRADGSIAMLDFDDCMLGWPVQDLGITVFELAAREDFEPLEAALRRGYERVAPWPERVPGEVRVFAADRCLMLANYIVQDHDPGVPGRGARLRRPVGREDRPAPGLSRRAQPASRARTSSWTRPFDDTTLPPVARRRSVELGDPAARFLDDDLERRVVPDVQLGLDHRLAGAACDERVPPEVAEAP